MKIHSAFGSKNQIRSEKVYEGACQSFHIQCFKKVVELTGTKNLLLISKLHIFILKTVET